MSRWAVTARPVTASASSVLTNPTAVSTPLPLKRSPPSRSSTASNWPVEAPLGTSARPTAPLVVVTSTSTVGFPRESITSRAFTDSIVI